MKKKIILVLFLILCMMYAPVSANSEETLRHNNALLIGNQNYSPEIEKKFGKLTGPLNDVKKMELSLLDQRQKYDIRIQSDLTKEGISESILHTFGDSKDGDFNILFYAGHGAYDPKKNLSYLVGSDGSLLSADDLEEILRNIPGTFWIILDCCNSGGFIDDKAFEVPVSIINPERISWSPFVPSGEKIYESSPTVDDFFGETEDSDLLFTNAFTESFRVHSRGLIGEKYLIFAAAHKTESSVERDFGSGWGWGGELTRGIARGNGYEGVFLADKNRDNQVSFNELAHYAKIAVHRSTLTVYPAFSEQILGEKNLQPDPQANVRHDVSVRKTWNIRFNGEVLMDSAEKKISVTNWEGRAVPLKIRKGSDKNIIEVIPENKYEETSYYQLQIQKGLQGIHGNRLKQDRILHFFTGKDPREEEAMNLVLNGYLEGYPSKTIGEAFAKTQLIDGTVQSFFYKPTWTYRLNAETAEDFIEFTGLAILNEKEVRVRAVFIVDLKERSFAMTFIGIDNQPLTEEQKKGLFEILYS